MKIAHLFYSLYHGKDLHNYEGSIEQIIAELYYGQIKMGHHVDLLNEYDFLGSMTPTGGSLPFDKNLKKYDIVVCHEYEWLHFLENIGINYIHIMHSGNTIKYKNHIALCDYWNDKNGGKAKVIYFGLTPERIPFHEKKDNTFLYMNTIVAKKGLLEILKIIDDRKLEIYGTFHPNAYYENEIHSLINIKPHVNFNNRWILNEEKYEKELPYRKGLLLAHIEDQGPESFSVGQLEAMFTGTPIVAYGNIYNNVSKHEVTGLITQNWEDYVKYLDIIKNIDPYKCREWAIENRSAEEMNKKHIKLYEEVANGRNW